MDNKLIYDEIGKLIKKERKKKGITQEQLADLTSYSLSFIANIESNTHQSFSMHTLYNIANALNISIHNLIPDQREIEIKNYTLFCNNCNYFVSIPKELGKSLKYLQETTCNNMIFTCPKYQKKKVELNNNF